MCVSLLVVSCVSVGSGPLRGDTTLEANQADKMLVVGLLGVGVGLLFCVLPHADEYLLSHHVGYVHVNL